MEKPKRPLSAYMLWLNHAREGIKKESPGIKVTEIAKKGGELWRGMKDKTVSIPRTCIFNSSTEDRDGRNQIFDFRIFFFTISRNGRTKPPN
jgi:HMG (high mobility group) box